MSEQQFTIIIRVLEKRIRKLEERLELDDEYVEKLVEARCRQYGLEQLFRRQVKRMVII